MNAMSKLSMACALGAGFAFMAPVQEASAGPVGVAAAGVVAAKAPIEEVWYRRWRRSYGYYYRGYYPRYYARPYYGYPVYGYPAYGYPAPYFGFGW
jgi:hypothetical protein